MFLEGEQPTTQTLEMCWSWVRAGDNKGVTLGYPCHPWVEVLVIMERMSYGHFYLFSLESKCCYDFDIFSLQLIGNFFLCFLYLDILTQCSACS